MKFMVLVHTGDVKSYEDGQRPSDDRRLCRRLLALAGKLERSDLTRHQGDEV